MKHITSKALVLVLTVALLIGVMAIPASATAAATFNAIPYQDGVLLTWNPTDIAWCEIAMFDEALPEPVTFDNLYGTQKHKLNRVNNNACSSGAFINEDSTFEDNAITFMNTPGKTYYFYIMARGVNGSGEYEWVYLDKIVYTVPAVPTLEVAANGSENTLTYTLADNGKDGTIYRYDSKAKAEAGGNDYDKAIDVTYGGDPVKDIVKSSGKYYYVLKQDTAQAFAAKGGISDNSGATDIKFEMSLTGGILTFNHPEGAQWTIMDIYTNDIDTAQDAGTAYKEVSGRLGKNIEGATDENAALYTTMTFTFNGTAALDINSAKLMPGQTYTMQLVSAVPVAGQADPSFPSSHITFTVPKLASSAVQEAENEVPVDTADFSVLAYAAAAFVAAGGSFALKRRKI